MRSLSVPHVSTLNGSLETEHVANCVFMSIYVLCLLARLLYRMVKYNDMAAIK